MRVEDAGTRTRLLAALAGCALVAWLLAVAGMGGRIEPLPDDPAQLAALPPVRPAPPLRLGPLTKYDALSARPLFSEDRQPQPFYLQGEGEPAQEQAFDYVLTSVLITPRLKLAIIQPAGGGEPTRVQLDQAPESHPGWRLVGLGERSAVFEGPEGRRNLSLRVYDGIGGERPTEIDRPEDRIPIAAPAQEAGTPAVREAAQAGGGPPADAPANVDDAAAEPSVRQAQMDAIRQRIEQRRARLRDPSRAQPPANSP